MRNRLKIFITAITMVCVMTLLYFIYGNELDNLFGMVLTVCAGVIIYIWKK